MSPREVEPRFKLPVAKKRPSPRRKRMPSEVAAEVILRSGGRCEAWLPGFPPRAEALHHRRRRGPGPHAAWNLLHLSHAAHQAVHAHPEWARRHGLILGNGDNPDVLHVGCPLTCLIDHRESA